jgi:hypothetical protein
MDAAELVLAVAAQMLAATPARPAPAAVAQAANVTPTIVSKATVRATATNRFGHSPARQFALRAIA